MSYAVCMIPVAHVRKAADHRAEMTNQVLFGECVRILEIHAEGWFSAEHLFDNYYGFSRLNQFMVIDELFPLCYEFTGEWVSPLEMNAQKLMLPFGADLSILKAGLPGLQFSYEGLVHTAKDVSVTPEILHKLGSLFLTSSYLWGGRSIFGIDCSGFVQTIFKMLMINLPRDANMQVAVGELVGFLQEARCGDLAFFDDEMGEIVHVGMMLGPSEIIHASGQVRIDPIDHEGIIHSESKLRTHHLRVIKRVI